MTIGRIAVLGRSTSIALMLCFVAPARAQTDGGAADPNSPDSIADHQAIIRDRVKRLEDRMFELSKVLRKMEPDRAARLLETLGAARSLGVRRKMDEIVRKIRDEAYSDAVDGQEEVTADLHELLKVLLEEPDRLEERKEEIEQLKQVKEALKKLIAEQERELAAAQAAEAEANSAQALEAAAEEVQKLLERQRSAAAGDSKATEDAAEQRGIRTATESLADKLEKLSETDRSVTGDAPPHNDSSGSNSEAAAEASNDLKDASEKMKSAEQSLESGRTPDARTEQKAAEKDLEAARDRLRKEAKELRKKLQLDKQAEDQRKTAEKTAELGKQMKGKPEGEGGEKSDRQGGDGQKGDESEDSQQGGEQSEQPMPGQQDIEGAVPLQEDAAEKLGAQDPDDAAKKQEEALQKLKQAQDELEDVLEQLRREQQEELLAALEARFRAMLAQQLECNKATGRLADVGKSNWKRSDQLQLADLSQKQRWVGTEADKALAVLVEDGTTVVFPQILEQIRDDVFDVADRLAAADVGVDVQATQADLADTIRQLLDAVKRMQEERDDTGGGGGGGGNNPLLPGSAELKLLRACQLRVNNATQSLDIDRLRPTVTADELTRRFEKLQQRQEYVADMAKDMHESMTRAQ